MKLKQVLFATLITTQFLSTSCNKSDSFTNPSPGITYKLGTINATSSIAQRLSATESTSIQWTSGFGSATQIKFEATKQNIEVEFKNNTNQKINLFSTIASVIGNVNLPAGTYDEVEFKIVLNKNGNDPALELNGTYAANGVNIPIVFRANELVEIKGEKKNVEVTATTVNTALTTIDLSLLVKGITQKSLTSAQLTNGTLIISADTNKELYNIIIKNLRNLHACDFEHR
jgi:hypothetical protein